MADLELVIKGGTVATAGGVVECDVGLRGGRVAIMADDIAADAAKVIDARGKIVMPGGIDSHCHIAQVSSFGLETADDFESGTRSAAAGGTTCIIPFAVQRRSDSLREKIEAYHGRATGKAIIDYAFHLIITDPTEQVLSTELPELIKEGYTSFKIYMTYDALKVDDFEALEILAVARRHGAMVMVHAENHDIIAWLIKNLLEAGKIQPHYHAMAHAAMAESEATHRIIALAEVIDVPVLIVHVSTQAAIEEIARARARGLRVYGETCPQYLFLTADDMNRPGFEGAKFICSPPLRNASDQDHVWRALETGILDILSSDHAPYRYSGTDGKAAAGVHAPFNKIANGVPGLEVRLPLLFSEGVRTGRLSIEKFVELSATRAAKLYGLYPRKGTVAVGSDADIALWDPDYEVTISSSNLHDNMDYSPYEGKRITGWPVMTLSRGEVMWDGSDVIGKPGHGRFLVRDKPLCDQTFGNGVLDNIE
jgi:dihydropyrimidinase